jgi:hypothetical protein
MNEAVATTLQVAAAFLFLGAKKAAMVRGFFYC